MALPAQVLYRYRFMLCSEPSVTFWSFNCVYLKSLPPLKLAPFMLKSPDTLVYLKLAVPSNRAFSKLALRANLVYL